MEVVYCGQCWSACPRQEGEGSGEKKKAQRTETEITTGLKITSTVAGDKFRTEVNKITEIIKVHRANTAEQPDQEYPLTRKLHRNCDLKAQSNEREEFYHRGQDEF